jgi:DNA-binding transcriptional LysR family regulator
MSTFNLRRIDLNLLGIFEVVYEERNQRKAAERLFMSQPAVSAAISRLRDIVQDRLFIVTARGLTPTPKADELYAAFHAALGVIRTQLGTGGTFSPSESQRIFRVAIEYGSGAALALPLFDRLRALAPNARLQIQTIPDEAARLARLKSGELDISISQTRTLESEIESAPINLHQGVFVVRSGHPRISDSPDVETMTREEFVLVHGQPMAYENQELDALVSCIKDRLVLEVPSAAVIPQIVRRTNLATIMSRQTLEALDCAEGLQIFELPISHVRGTAFVHWSVNAQEATQWFKELVLSEIRSLADGCSSTA